MRFLTNLLSEKKEDLTRLPHDFLKENQKKIRKGPEDLQQKWANALELVHKSYEVAAVQRPSPDMKDAWEQYEENIAYAVKQLSDARGLDDDWRMSSAMFHEAFENNMQKWRINMWGKSYIIETQNIGTVIDDVINRIDEDPEYEGIGYDVNNTENGVEIRFSRFGIKQNERVTIEKAT